MCVCVKFNTIILFQNMSGVKGDIIAALMLHPGCEECQSLIARAFPGESAQELMLSDVASKVRVKLDAEMKRIAKLYSSVTDHDKSHTSSDAIPPIASQYLAGIEIKMAEEDGEPKSKIEAEKSGTSQPPELSPTLHTKSTGRQSSSSIAKPQATSLFDSSFIDNTGTSKHCKIEESVEKLPPESQEEENGSMEQCMFVHYRYYVCNTLCFYIRVYYTIDMII